MASTATRACSWESVPLKNHQESLPREDQFFTKNERVNHWPPLFNGVPSKPPQMTIFEPVHTAVWYPRALGAPVVLVGVHMFVVGL